MRIDLRTCDTRVLGLADDVRRRESALRLCERLGLRYRIVDAVRCAPADIGCGLSHLRVLRDGDGPLPLLVLEDDVLETASFRPELAIPDDADAVWLGASVFGAVRLADHLGFEHMQLLDEAADGLLRAYNLLCAHAILYLSERFRSAAIGAITASLADLGRPPDCGLAMIQRDFNVYTLREPLFYQAAHLQRRGRQLVDGWTRITLKPTPVGATCLFDAPGRPRGAIAVRTASGALDWAWADESGRRIDAD